MRLKAVERLPGLRGRLRLWLKRLRTGVSEMDIEKITMFRPQLFGGPFTTYARVARTGATQQETAWRELMAAYVSRKNQCEFCVGSKGAAASRKLSRDVVGAVLADPATAPITKQQRAILGFLEKLTLSPANVAREDVEQLRRLGVTDDAIEDAIHVCVVFAIINRVANALGVEGLPEDTYAQWARSGPRERLARLFR